MPRPKKDSKILNVRLDKEINDKLEKFYEESGPSKTVAVERFLNRCLDEYFSKPEEEKEDELTLRRNIPIRCNDESVIMFDKYF